jgi:four helix bundle protein
MNRAVNSISLNIAEEAAKSSNKAFAYHLGINLGSAWEVVSASFLACDRSYITETEQKELYLDGEQLSKSINAFRNTLR